MCFHSFIYVNYHKFYLNISILKRLLRMDETGLLFLWQQGTSVDGKYCIQKIQQEVKEHMKSGHKKRLTMKDLSGAFVILGIGYAIGIITFIMENYCARNFKNCKAVGNRNASQNTK